MLYRVYIPTPSGSLFFMSMSEGVPATDSFVFSEDTSFLNNCKGEEIFTFTTKDLAQKAIDSLEYPFNEKADIMECNSIEDKVVRSIYYRVVRKYIRKPLAWFSMEKTTSFDINPNTAKFNSIPSAEEFKNSLSGFNKKLSEIVKILDYGEPDYDFDYTFIKSGKTIRCDDANPTIVEL